MQASTYIPAENRPKARDHARLAGAYAFVVIALAPWVGLEAVRAPTAASLAPTVLGLGVLGAAWTGRLPRRVNEALWLVALPLCLAAAAAVHERDVQTPLEHTLYLGLAASALVWLVLEAARRAAAEAPARTQHTRPSETGQLTDGFRWRRRALVIGSGALAGLVIVASLAMPAERLTPWAGAEAEARLLLLALSTWLGVAWLTTFTGPALRHHRRELGPKDTWQRALPWLVLGGMAMLGAATARWLGL